MRSEFFTHADAGIRNTVSEYDIVRGSSGFTEGFKSNASTIMGEFYGIAYDIDQDLTKPYFVSQHIMGFRFIPVYDKLQITVDSKAVGDIQYRVCNGSNIDRFRIIGDISTLDTADVQYIIDQG